MHLRHFFVVYITLLLVACGGGGDSTGSAVPQSFTVTATASTGGTISPSSATVLSGSTTSFQVAAADGYSISSVSGCGGSLNGSTYTTGAVRSNCSVTANFTRNTYLVSTTTSDGVSITPTTVNVPHGDSQVFELTVASGYELISVDGCAGNLNGTSYTTGAITLAWRLKNEDRVRESVVSGAARWPVAFCR